MRKLVAPFSVKQTTAPGAENEPPNKMRKISSEIIEEDKLKLLDTSPNRWLSLKGIDRTKWTKLDKSSVTIIIINFAQELLQTQFPHISGLQSTLVLGKYQLQKGPVTPTYLQIIHTRENHWNVEFRCLTICTQLLMK